MRDSESVSGEWANRNVNFLVQYKIREPWTKPKKNHPMPLQQMYQTHT